jgi:hypothetical protein
MSDASREQLYADLQDFGAIAVTMPSKELSELLGLPRKRAERLKSWVKNFGSLDPRRRGTQVASPRSRIPTDGETWMVVGDVHVAPGQSYRRLKWLGTMARELKVDRLIQGGDWNSYDSLCEARSLLERSEDRLKDELAATELSLREFHDGLGDYAVPLDVLGGNHDDRPSALADKAPWLEGVFDVWDAHRKRGWAVHKYLEPVRMNGILFQHYLTGRGTGRAISGMFHAKRLLERVNFQESVVVFHSHRLQWWMARHKMKTVHGLVAGCYMEHREDYAGMDNDEWWSGVVLLRNVRDGDFDIELWSIDRIRDTFG